MNPASNYEPLEAYRDQGGRSIRTAGVSVAGANLEAGEKPREEEHRFGVGHRIEQQTSTGAGPCCRGPGQIVETAVSFRDCRIGRGNSGVLSEHLERRATASEQLDVVLEHIRTVAKRLVKELFEAATETDPVQH